jgi:hypothetical protein
MLQFIPQAPEMDCSIQRPRVAEARHVRRTSHHMLPGSCTTVLTIRTVYSAGLPYLGSQRPLVADVCVRCCGSYVVVQTGKSPYNLRASERPGRRAYTSYKLRREVTVICRLKFDWADHFSSVSLFFANNARPR